MSSLTEPLENLAPDELATQISVVVQKLMGVAGASPVGLGVSASGSTVEPGVLDSEALGWELVRFGKIVEERTGFPTTITNDLVGLTLLEQWFGLGLRESSFVVVSIGSGIGHGLVHNTRLVDIPGHGPGATEHMPLAGAKGLCSYGHVGCAAGALTTGALLTRARAGRTCEDWAATTLTALVESATGGDIPSQEVIRHLAVGLAAYLNIVTQAAGVQDVVLDGEGTLLLRTPWAKNFDEELERYASPRFGAPQVHLRSGTFERWARGAAVASMVHWLEAQVAALT